MTLGNVSAVSSKNTSPDWPSPISRSNSRTAWLIQYMDTNTRAKNPNSIMSCDSIYLSNLDNLSPVAAVNLLLQDQAGRANCYLAKVGDARQVSPKQGENS